MQSGLKQKNQSNADLLKVLYLEKISYRWANQLSPVTAAWALLELYLKTVVGRGSSFGSFWPFLVRSPSALGSSVLPLEDEAILIHFCWHANVMCMYVFYSGIPLDWAKAGFQLVQECNFYFIHIWDTSLSLSVRLPAPEAHFSFHLGLVLRSDISFSIMFRYFQWKTAIICL